MKTEKDYSDLHNKTIFDFCDNDEILIKVEYALSCFDKSQWYRFKEEYLQDHTKQMWSLLKLAKLIGDKKLYKETKKQFAHEFECYFNV